MSVVREFGGYIEFEHFHGHSYHERAIALNSGRHCVEYLIRSRDIRKLYLPFFMCSSVYSLCERLAVEVEYYHIDRHFYPLFQREPEEDAWLYIVNYYGQLSQEKLLEYKREYERVIVDNAQAYFAPPLVGVDTCYTCRKFFGVADGGYLYTEAVLEQELPQDLSHDRMDFLLGRFEKGANEFYSLYAENNERFLSQPLKRMSALTENILRSIDYERVKNIRTENFAYLHERLGHINQLELSVPEGAFMYPLYIENGAETRKKLHQRKVYVPTLWPDVFELCRESEPEFDLAANILPLPIDQRYTTADMAAMIEEVMKCIN